MIETVNARLMVTKRVAARARRFPRLDIAPLETEGLADRDAALAQAIDHAVTRRWLTLVTVLSTCLDRRWDRLNPAVQAPLLVGAAQLLLMDRLPDHAVINEAVQCTKQGPQPKASGLVNAVLHRVADLRGDIVPTYDAGRRDELPLSDGRAWRLTRDVFPADAADRRAGATSHPRALLDAWTAEHGPEGAERLARHSLMHAPTIVRCAGDVPGAGTGTVAGGPSDFAPHHIDGFHVYRGPRGRLRELLERNPAMGVQDPGAAAAVLATAWLKPRVVVDACAGRGTKTRQLAALHAEAEIIATDIDDARRDDLRLAARVLPRVTVVDPDRLVEHVGRADLVVLDVPCSNTAVLGRRLEARYRFDEATVSGLVDRQRQIIADAIPLLADDGRILYSTCSLQAAENHEQVRWLARWHRMNVSTMRQCMPAGQPGDPPAAYSDGGFFGLLGRGADRGA